MCYSFKHHYFDFYIQLQASLTTAVISLVQNNFYSKKSKQRKADPLHAMVVLGGRGDIAPTHS
jgi:hypothetical protein